MTKPITYTKLEITLSKLGSQLNAAETHGLLTGILSISTYTKGPTWRNTLLENLDCAPPTESEWGVLSDASSQILHALTENNFQFNLLLPNDNSPLPTRLDALGFWCRGYLSGLGLIGITKEDLAHTTLQELIADLSHIAHVSIETDGCEEDESHYMELVEFVRVAVQNIQTALQDIHPRMLH